MNAVDNVTNGPNGLPSILSDGNRALTIRNGVPKHTFYLHLKETEFRFNHRRDNLYQELMKLLRTNPI